MNLKLNTHYLYPLPNREGIFPFSLWEKIKMRAVLFRSFFRGIKCRDLAIFDWQRPIFLATKGMLILQEEEFND
jgi:hypothetical protein